MNKIPHSFKNVLILLALATSLAIFVFMALGPSQTVKAAEGSFQEDASSCKYCHEDQYQLWSQSQHGSVPINCETCHRLAGEGAHPEVAYLTADQSLTCDTCHADLSSQWKASRHGEIDLGCASCHEVHSQQLKLLDNSQLICANCHKDQYKAVHDSTHEAAGLTCKNCHLGADSGHTFKATIASCEACHTDLHEAKDLITAGATIKPMDSISDEATAEPVAEATAEPEATQAAEKGGINLPSWLLLLAGLLIGGVVSWVVFGKDPGTPTSEK